MWHIVFFQVYYFVTMKKFPVTQAIRFLRAHNISFTPKVYDYIEHGGTAHSAQELGVDEHTVIKTIVLADEQHQGLIALMHGDCEISTRNLARHIGVKHIEPVTPGQATKFTGYLVGGTSPFGIKNPLPIYIQHTIKNLDIIRINGGKRGFLVEMNPADLEILHPVYLDMKA